MMAGDPQSVDRLAVLACRISDIGLPAISWVAQCQAAHDAVAGYLGDDGGGSDREAQRIAFDDGLDCGGDGRGDGAVDERHIGADPEHVHGARHRQQRRAQDVDAVDFVHAGRADPDPRGSAIDALPERAVASLALSAGQHLRIVELVAEHFRETAGVDDHRSRDHRAGKWPAPGLVDAAHQPLAPAFKREIRHAPLLVAYGGRFGKRGGGVALAENIAMFDRVSRLTSPFAWRRLRGRQAAAVFPAIFAVLCFFAGSPSGAIDLFARHEVTVQFATPDGKPMADAEVRVFAPGDPGRTALTGRTDAAGKFVFDADRDGLWGAEAGSPDYVARVMIRVGGETQSQNWLSPLLLVGFLLVLLAIAIWYRLLRARTRGPKA
jgi:hypothetical protein